MHWTLAHIGNRFPAADPAEVLTRTWLGRITGQAQAESVAYRSEADLFESLSRPKQGRAAPFKTAPLLVLLDSRGRQMTSEAFASWLAARRDDGSRHILFAIGPASGWSEESRARASLLLSLGSMTMAHALARAVLAEQLYRAYTILSGHPYHTGH
jgi:23S rRNA (pseudouridine1915-N3)-methyltransferase